MNAPRCMSMKCAGADLIAEALAIFDLMLTGCREPSFGDYQNGEGETIGPRMDALHSKLRCGGTASTHGPACGAVDLSAAARQALAERQRQVTEEGRTPEHDDEHDDYSLENTLNATTVYARADHVICPHCEAEVDGWCGDPRGKETECDDCRTTFTIAGNSDVRLA